MATSAVSFATFEDEPVLAGQSRALELVVMGAPLQDVFIALVQTLEADVGEEAVGAILLLDSDGKTLRQGAAPSLPDSYNEAIDGIQIGPNVGTCAAAAFLNEVVITPDIATAPSWEPFAHLPLGLGLRAAWSMPIRARDGHVVGTFGTYFREARRPTPRECGLVAVLARTASVAIESRATAVALREEERFLQGVIKASADCIKILSLEGDIEWISENGLNALECSDFGQLRGRSWLDQWPDPATRQRAEEAAACARAGGTGRLQGHCATMRGTDRWWDVALSLIRADSGEGRALLCVSRDITALKQGEAARKLSHQLATANERLRGEIDERRKAERERRVLLQQLDTAEENERRRISRELHDEVGQHLTALSLGLNSLHSHLPEAQRGELTGLQALIDAVVKQVHRVALELRPTALDDFGLHQALTVHLEQWSRRTGIPVQFRHEAPLPERFPPPIESTVYRVVQEALTNVAKHAGAHRVAVAVERCTDHVLAVVEDDGRGIDPQRAADAQHTRLGLRGMRERAEAHGGTVSIESSPGQGTTIVARIPLAPISPS